MKTTNTRKALKDNYSIIIELDSKAWDLFEGAIKILEIEGHEVYHFNKDVCIINGRFTNPNGFKVFENSVRAHQSRWYDDNARDIVKAMKNNKMRLSSALEALKGNLNDFVMTSLKHHEKLVNEGLA